MMSASRFFLYWPAIFLALTHSAASAAVNATWNSATDVAVTASSYTATENTVNFALNFTPPTGTNLTVLNNTGIPFISGTFSNLTQGQIVNLSYNGLTYQFVASYYGGTGNDLVLLWADTRPVAWGYGALGNSGGPSTTPVAVTTAGTPLAGRTILAFSASWDYSLAVCSDGSIASWGSNYYGQLGNNSTRDATTPVAVQSAGTPLEGRTVISAAANNASSLALCSDGTLAAWGYNGEGELGNNTNTNSTVPVAVTTAGTPLAGKRVVAISAGSMHRLVLCTDGTLAAWGYNHSGELGNNTNTSSTVPVAVTTAGTPLAGKTVVVISAGGSHNIVLCSDGTLVTWGLNNCGQLGTNSTTNSSMPVAVTTAGTALAGKTVVAVAAGVLHSLALCSDGTLTTWGNNSDGELGNSTNTNSSVPVAVTTAGTPLAGKTVVALAAGDLHSMVLCSDGTLVTWGGNSNGELGNNTTTGSSVPVAVSTSSLAAGEIFAQAASGPNSIHSFALVATPVPVVAATLPASSVSTTGATLNGMMHTSGDTTAVSFDYGPDTAYGTNVMGTPASVSSASPTAVSTTLTGLSPATTYHFRVSGVNSTGTHNGVDATFTTLDNNADLSGLVLSAGTLTPAFDSSIKNYSATVSSTTSSFTLTPAAHGTATVSVNGLAVAAGGTSSPIPLNYGDNTVNVQVMSQDASTTNLYSIKISRTIPAQITAAYGSAADVPVISSSLNATGSTINFTLNFAPPTGTCLTVVNNTGPGFINGTFANLAQGQIVSLSYNGTTYQFVATYNGGTGNDLVLMWAGTRLVAWGSDVAGELGDNSTTSSSAPVSVPTAGTPLAGCMLLALATGYQHSLALCSDGSMAAWGYNGDGELGDNTTTDSKTPVAVTTAGTPLAGKTVVAVSAGFSHNLVLCSDGTLATWGYNDDGELGNNSTTHSTVPVAVTTAGTPLAGKTVTAISAGSGHNLVLCSDGTLVTWGYNVDGELGNNTTTYSTVPVAVTTAGTPLAGKTVAAISAGSSHNLVLCSDGTLVTWGDNEKGQLGNNSTTNSSVPVAVLTTGTALAGKTVIAIAAGGYHSLALCSDGTLAAWGYNAYEELGNSTYADSHVPVAVSTSSALAGKSIIGLTAGVAHSVAWCSDGTVTAWGDNSYGQLGYITATSSAYPIPSPMITYTFAPGERYFRVTTGSSSFHGLGLVASPLPAIYTGAAASVTATTAVLQGNAAANGGTTAVSFDYGLSASYGTHVAATPASVTGIASTTVSVALTGLTPATTYHFRLYGANSSGSLNGFDMSFTTLSLQQDWRQQNFGTYYNSGSAADTADYDGDGIPNLMEYALNLNPTAASRLPVSTARKGANFEYTYTRSTTAVNAGTTYVVQWNASLSAASWGSSGVTQTILSNDGTTQQVKAVIPMNAATRMFVHLTVIAPP